MRHRSLAWPIAALVAVARVPPAVAQTVSKSSATDCAAVQNLKLPDVRITAVKAVSADNRPTAQARVPHCLVSGIIGREIRFWVWLPDQWNQRFFMGGAGGFAGGLDNQALSSINEGYATAATDTGHEFEGIMAGWALNNIERQLNYGHLAMHRTTEVAKGIIRAYYNSDPVRSYFFGCSNGGREALMEAQRYPEDYDGIVAGAPALSITRVAAAFIKNLQASFPDPQKRSESVISPANLKLLDTSILAACDATDGVRDGVVDDPTRCPFRVSSLPACPADQAGPNCVTGAQRAAIERIYAPVTSAGKTIYSGRPLGGEPGQFGWQLWISGVTQQLLNGTGGRFPSLQFAFGTEFFKYFIFADSTWDYRRYDFSTWERDTRAVSQLIDAESRDLSAFKARGGKLILWHGWGDPALSATETTAYYQGVEQRDPAVRDFARLFMLPGVLHCFNGPGPDRVNWYGAIADWVEKNNPPTRIVAAKVDSAGKQVRARPLCPYPERAVYQGSGSTDDAANFACRR